MPEFARTVCGRASGLSPFFKGCRVTFLWLLPAVAALCLTVAQVEAAEVSPDSDPCFLKMWQGITALSNDAADLAASDRRDEKTTLEMVTFREPRYVRLLREARNILGQSETGVKFDEIEALRADNRKLENEITELKKKRVAAPSSSVNPLKDTKASIDEKLAECGKSIERNKEAVEQLKSDLLTLFNRRGFDISYEQLGYFLISAEGGELRRLMTVAENMKQIQQVIERQLARDTGNIDLARYYAGMYLISLDAYSSAHEAAIGNIRAYRDRLALIRKEARANFDEAERLCGTADGNDLQNLRSNLKINEKTIEVADMYDALLRRRIEELQRSRDIVDGKVKIARNAYRTIANGGALIGLVHDGANDYMLLMSFEIPELKNMYDEAVMSAFVQIADRIKNEN